MPTSTLDFELEVGTSRLWAGLKDSAQLFPKLAPQLFSSIEPVEGKSGEAGFIRIVKLGPIAPEGSFVKEKYTAIDHANFSATTEEIEGGHLSQGFTKWVSNVKLVPIGDSKTKVESAFEYEGGDETGVEKSKEGYVKILTGLAGYIKSSGAYA